jgi:GTP-binding protein EngB required for normal cell division
MSEDVTLPFPTAPPAQEKDPVSLAREIIECFGLSDLLPLLHAIERHESRRHLNIAVFGRFKAGKSSFLNELIGRPLLPVGLLPVTAVVTEISYGPEEYAELVHRDGRSERAPLYDLADYVTESGNPGNVKEIEVVRTFLPSLVRFRELRFVDTPGLESVLAHNTEASLSWSPNVDLALVAVGVDPPLTQQDITLIGRLLDFTPNVSVLLTKMDTLDESGQREVFRFVETQLGARFPASVPVFPYSVRPGYARLREQFERQYLLRVSDTFHQQRVAVRNRKLHSFFNAAQDYLQLLQKSARALDADRDALRSQVLGGEKLLTDQKLQFQLLARHAAARARSGIEAHLQRGVVRELQTRLSHRFSELFPSWRGGFARVLSQFEQWLHAELVSELSQLSAAERSAFLQPLADLEQQCRGNLQIFRDRLSEQVLRVFGVPLRTAETEIEVDPPRFPDVSVGRVFDHNWELLSWLIPMWLVRGTLRRRLLERIDSEVQKNLSRLTSQWEDVLVAAIHRAEKEAERRLDELVRTVRRLLSADKSPSEDSINSYLSQIRALLIR